MQGSFCILEFIGMQEMTEMERSEIEVMRAFAGIRKETAILQLMSSKNPGKSTLSGAFLYPNFVRIFSDSLL